MLGHRVRGTGLITSEDVLREVLNKCCRNTIKGTMLPLKRQSQAQLLVLLFVLNDRGLNNKRGHLDEVRTSYDSTETFFNRDAHKKGREDPNFSFLGPVTSEMVSLDFFVPPPACS